MPLFRYRAIQEPHFVNMDVQSHQNRDRADEERQYLLRSRLRGSIRNRWTLIPVALAVVLGGYGLGLTSISVLASVVLAAASEDVEGVGEVAENARTALATIVGGLERSAHFVEQVGGNVETEAEALDALLVNMAQIQQIAAEETAQAQEAASALAEQVAALTQLSRTSQRVADSAAALTELASRFTIADAPAEPAPAPPRSRPRPTRYGARPLSRPA